MTREQELAELIIQRHDWNWLARYGEVVTQELALVFEIAFEEELSTAKAVDTMAARLSILWAETRAAELLSATEDASLLVLTQQRVRTVLAEGLREGLGVRAIARRLESDIGFSRSRADMIAQTETMTALAQGSRGAALSQGRDQKRWNTQGTATVCNVCADNEAQGWIPAGDPFVGGRDVNPQHPRCRCRVRYRTSALALSAPPSLVRVARCPSCRWKAAENVNAGARLWCKRCNAEFEVLTGVSA